MTAWLSIDMQGEEHSDLFLNQDNQSAEGIQLSDAVPPAGSQM